MRMSDWSSDECSSELTQPHFTGHTYRFNRSKRVVHAKPRSATSIIRGGKQVDHLGVEIVRLAGRDFAKPTRAIGSARAKVGHILEFQAGARLPAGQVGHLRQDRKSVVEGKRVSVRGDLGGRGIIQKKKKEKN